MRTLQTAQIVAQHAGSQVITRECFQEFDFGDWTGRSFAELAPDPRWQRFNAARSSAPTPGGETMPEVAVRAIAGLRAISTASPAAIVVSHADVIRAVLVSLLGMDFDHFQRLTVDTASISEVLLTVDSATVLRINDCAHLEGVG